MKVMKLALLGTAALAAVSVSARADELSDLKAQVETLNARVATLEATPAVPAGYSLVSFSKGQDLTVPGYFEGNRWQGPAHVISVVPTADAPAAPSAVITWSGWVRGAVIAVHDVNTNATVVGTPIGTVTVTTRGRTDNYSADIRVRGEIVVSGKTDTAIGEVGARLALETGAGTTDSAYRWNGTNNGAVTTDGFWGWWKMTPALTLGAGIDGSLAKNSQGFDAKCTCYYEPEVGGIFNNPNGGDPAQIRLSYADGPIGFAIAVEDSNNGTDIYGVYNASSFGVAAKATWNSDIFQADLSGGYWGHAGGAPNGYTQDAWAVDFGLGANIGNFANISAAVGWGAGFYANSDTTKASAILSGNFTDVVHAEIGVGHQWNGGYYGGSVADTTWIAGGLYYNPVKQLTIGFEGGFIAGGYGDGSYGAGLVTIFRF